MLALKCCRCARLPFCVSGLLGGSSRSSRSICNLAPYTLADYPNRMVHLGCAKCGRAGRFGLDRLIAQYGADVKLPDLRHRLAQCPPTLPNHRPVRETDVCGVEFPGLVRMGP
jgi:hypothetical protein